MRLFITSTQHRLITHIAQEPTGVSRSGTYHSRFTQALSFGIFSLLVIAGGLYTSTSSASTLERDPTTDSNSQKINLLNSQQTVRNTNNAAETNISVDNKLALLVPKIGIVPSGKKIITTGSDNVSVQNQSSQDINTYTVQSGDTLSAIAYDFDVSINTIKWENNIGTTIKPGMKLRILPITGIRHTIKKGDTFAKIAKLYKAEAKDIGIFNDLKEDELVIGKKILVPNGTKQTIVKKPTVSKSAAKISSSTSANGYYIRPTTGPVTSKFGPRKGRYHYGIDYGAPTGTPIYATADGKVTRTTCGSGYGKCLLIKHPNGTESLYAHASALYVGVGAQVKQGETIAAVGSTGRSTGPHLHFEIREANEKKRNVNFLR